MFVPSLSWEMIVFMHKWLKKRRCFSHRGCASARKQPRIDPCRTTHRRCQRRFTFAPTMSGFRPGRAMPIQPPLTTRVTASSEPRRSIVSSSSTSSSRFVSATSANAA